MFCFGLLGLVEMVWLVQFGTKVLKSGSLLGQFCIKAFLWFWIDVEAILSPTTDFLLLYFLKIKMEFSMKFTLHQCYVY